MKRKKGRRRKGREKKRKKKKREKQFLPLSTHPEPRCRNSRLCYIEVEIASAGVEEERCRVKRRGGKKGKRGGGGKGEGGKKSDTMSPVSIYYPHSCRMVKHILHH